jgi:hypothetical protein
MPLRKDITSPHGATAQHHWIAQRVTDYRTNSTELLVHSFINRQARLDGKYPLMQQGVSLAGAPSLAECYTALAAPGALLASAIDEA